MIDTPFVIHYKIYMNATKRLIILWVILALTACQALPTAAPTPTPTITAGPSPTPLPPPTSTPFPTPIPVARIDSGDQALFYGDYDMAREQYNAVLKDSSDRALQAAALWGLGRTDLADGHYQQVIDTLNHLTVDYPESTYAARAYFLMGQAYDGLGQYKQSADAYNTYMTHIPGVLDAYVQEYRGDALTEAKDYTDALNAYTAALNASRLDDGLTLQIKIAQTRASFGDYAGALTLYDQIYASTTNGYIQAQMDYLAGNAHKELGQTDEAYARYLHAVQNYPLSYYSYLSLVELVDANIAVSDLDRGLVDYYAAQYDVALASLDRYLKATPSNDGTAHYYRALTLRETQRTQEAIDEFDLFIKGYPGNSHWTEAWDDKAFLEWAAQGDYATAQKTLLDYVATVPGSTSAVDFLMTAARVAERDNRLEDAAQIWERVAIEYPANEQVPMAVFLAGIARYRLNDFSGALTTFQRDLLFASQPEDQARAYLWIGITQQKLGEATSAEESWQQGQAVDPTGYYSLRARDLIMKRAPFESPPSVNLNPDLSQEQKEAETWLRVKFNLPADTDLSGPGVLAQDPRFVRGTELWELGMYDESRLEFESLREFCQLKP